MFSILVKPQENEAAFVKMASKLGYGRVIFAYLHEPKSFVPEPNTVKISKAVVCEKSACRQVQQLGYIPLLQPDREVFERMKNTIVYGLEQSDRNDGIHQRSSGLNQVLCALAAKNNIAVLCDIHALKSLDISSLSLILGRIQQNLRLCMKYKVPVIISSVVSKPEDLPNPIDLMSFAKVLGLSPDDAKKAVSFQP